MAHKKGSHKKAAKGHKMAKGPEAMKEPEAHKGKMMKGCARGK
jgi:hypothetical protein